MIPHTIATLLQGVIGALLVYCIRNDWNEKVLGLSIGRSIWTALAILFGAVLIVFPTWGVEPWWQTAVKGVIGTGLLGYVLTAPHGQTLRGPHQDIPPEEDDPVFEVAMFISGHKGGAGDELGWPTWLWYNAIRYAMPCALIGALLHSWLAGISGVLTVIFYWPIAFIPVVRSRFDTRFFGAAWCGFWVFVGL
jgi:hypothetical protein